MRYRLVRVLPMLAAGLFLLTGCESWNKTATGFGSAPKDADPAANDSTGALPTSAGPGDLINPGDDLNLGKRHFRAGNYGLAEQHFRRAVEKGPHDAGRDAEAWLGLAASYDRLRRFELADRAYAHALKILGPTCELLNNQGYSYLMRGDYRQARIKLAAARDLDPTNPYVQNNLDLLEKSVRGEKP